MMQPLQITHIITDLDTGGAEIMLLKLLESLDRRQFTNRVISLTGDGSIGEKIRSLGIETQTLSMRPGFPDLKAFLRLRESLRRTSPDLVQTWMYHADLVGGLAAKFAGAKPGGRIPVLWNLRNYNLDPAVTRRSTLWVVRMCALLSGWLPDAILTNAWAAAEVHIRRGYHAGKIRVIPNGFDGERFRPDPAARVSVREELNLLPDKPLVGMAARFDPLKDHQTFIQAAALIHRAMPETVFLLCGQGIDWQNELLCAWIEQTGLWNAFRLLGLRQDMPRLLASLDVAVLSSIGEAFANVIGEAMACGIPCVATDVGDSALVVGKTGRIVPLRQPETLADAVQDLLNLSPDDRRKLGQQGRERIIEHFSLQTITAQYAEMYIRTAQRHKPNPPNHPTK